MSVPRPDLVTPHLRLYLSVPSPCQVQTVMERAYVEEDLHALGINSSPPQVSDDPTFSKDLTQVILIQRQILDKSANGRSLEAKLLDPNLGFTTTDLLLLGAISSPVLIPAVPEGISNNAQAIPLIMDAIGEASRTGSSGAEQTSMVNEDIKDIHLLTDDSRTTSEVVKTFQHVKFPTVDFKESEEGGWRAKILPDDFTVVGEIRVPAHFDGSSTEYFVQMDTDEPIGSLEFDPELLVIPKNNRLNLRIGRIPQGNSQPADPEQGSQASSSVTIESVSGFSGSVAWIKEPSAREIEWLKDRVEIYILLGYANFEANRHKNLQNLDHVEYWRFAVNVDQQFYKTSWPAEISTGKITKPAIQQALQMGTTALVESIQMIGTIDHYTAQGYNYSAEVAAEISKSDQEDPKATALKAFLVQWEKHHPAAK
ncbi:hypothetical protein B0H11DRAFT_1903633 [Mycena galericulata]|nr:hypothetical protein B0H11DRAFT_1903633 [Mycena galericulata]